MAVANFHSTQIDFETSKVAEALKVMAQQLNPAEIVELTKDDVKWSGNQIGSKLKRILERSDGEIIRVSRGLYAHRDYVDGNGKFRVVPRAPQKPPEDPKPAVAPRVPIPTPKPKPEIDDVKPSGDSLQLLQSFKNDTRAQMSPPVLKQNPLMLPEFGADFTGVITGVEPYGIFVEKPHTRLAGLCHISNMRETISPSFAELQTMFKMGDEVKTRVIGHRQGRLALSMKGLPLPEPQYSVKAPEPAKTEIDPRLAILQKVKHDIKEEHKTMPVPQNDQNFNELIGYLRSKIGKVSAEAEQKLYATWQKYGMFKVMMAFTKAVDNFDADVSVMFAAELEKQMGDSL